MEPNQTELKEIKIIGIQARTSNLDEKDPELARIPGLWKTFFVENTLQRIESGLNVDKYLGVYTDYESDVDGDYTLILGTEVPHLKNIPEGMTGITIPAQKYLVFPAIGKIPDAVLEAWGNIWDFFAKNKAVQRAYTSDIEQYSSDGISIHIAIK